MGAGLINVLVADDEPHVCRLIENILAGDQFHCTSAYSGEKAKHLLLEDNFDVIILDMLMPNVSGMDLLNFISSQGLHTQAICVTGVSSLQSCDEALAAGAFDFLEKPLDLTHLIDSVRRAAGCCSSPVGGGIEASPPEKHPANKQKTFHTKPVWADSNERLKQMLLESASALTRTVEAKDPYTRKHSDHVAYYAEQLARGIGESEEATESIRISALLHDIGKIAVPDSILVKPGKLSRAEFAFIRRHPDVGAAILKNISMMKAEARLVLYHHENWNGSGYPTGLVGKKIPRGSQILNIADSIDAMLMHRTYKQAYPVDRMLEELDRGAGRQFDPYLARQAIDWCQNNPSELILPKKILRAKTA